MDEFAAKAIRRELSIRTKGGNTTTGFDQMFAIYSILELAFQTAHSNPATQPLGQKIRALLGETEKLAKKRGVKKP